MIHTYLFQSKLFIYNLLKLKEKLKKKIRKIIEEKLCVFYSVL